MTGASSSTLPASTSCMMAVAVIGLVVEPTATGVWGGHRAGLVAVGEAVAARQGDLAVLDDGEREAGDGPGGHPLLNVRIQLLLGYVECRRPGPEQRPGQTWRTHGDVSCGASAARLAATPNRTVSRNSARRERRGIGSVSSLGEAQA